MLCWAAGGLRLPGDVFDMDGQLPIQVELVAEQKPAQPVDVESKKQPKPRLAAPAPQ
jgi:hypothetical protein